MSSIGVGIIIGIGICFVVFGTFGWWLWYMIGTSPGNRFWDKWDKKK